MRVMQGFMRYGKRRAVRKLVRAVPILGAVVAVATLGQAIRRKGVLGGSLDTALDAVPYLGGAKSVCEAWRGRDFIRERQLPVQ
jgi:hypothetical protein